MRIWIVAFLVACGSSSRTAPAKITDGTRITYSVDLDAALDEKASALAKRLGSELKSAGVEAEVTTTLVPTGGLVVRADPLRKAEVHATLKAKPELVFTECPVSEDPRSLCARISEEHALQLRKAALDETVTAIQKRIKTGGLSATVAANGTNVVVDYAPNDQEQLARARDVIARWGRLEIKAVDNNSAFMRNVYQQASEDRKLTAEVDQWRTEAGETQVDFYLFAPSRDAIWNYLKELAQTDRQFVVPDDRQIGYEPFVAPDGRSFVRTYLLERGGGVSGRSITSAVAQPATSNVQVMVELDATAKQELAALTGARVGKKIAIVLDDRVMSAPIVNNALTAGRFSIAVRDKREADELAAVLRAGPLPAPMREETAHELRGGKVVPNPE